MFPGISMPYIFSSQTNNLTELAISIKPSNFLLDYW